MELQLLAFVLSLVGAILNIQKNANGFLVWFFSCVVWISWSAGVQPIPWFLILTQVLFAVLNVYGFITWSKGTDKI